MTGAVIWRIDKAVFAKDARRGTGPRLYGGRWTSPGAPAVYCAGSLSLALLEILVHVDSREDSGVKRVMFRIELGAVAIEEIALKRLPKRWRSALDPTPCRRIGDAWLKARATAVLKVPSAIVPLECNYLLNPAHPDFRKLRWSRATPFQFDSRLVQSIMPPPVR